MTMPDFFNGQIVGESEMDQMANAINALNAASEFAKYVQLNAQNIPTGTGAFTKVKFDGTPEATAPGVSASGVGNTDFTISTAGLWGIIGSMGYVAAAGGGQRSIWVINTNGITRYGAHSTFPGTSNCSLQCLAFIRISTPLTVAIGTLQASGGGLNTEAPNLVPTTAVFARLGP